MILAGVQTLEYAKNIEKGNACNASSPTPLSGCRLDYNSTADRCVVFGFSSLVGLTGSLSLIVFCH